MTRKWHSPDHARLFAVGHSDSPTAVALVVHGGRSMSDARVRPLQIAVLRLRPIASAIAAKNPEIAVYRLQTAARGWNGVGVGPMRDARWALDQLRAQHPGLPIVLVGHSMGARTCFRLAGDADVVGVVGLAPWLPADEPVRQVVGSSVRIIHGSRDRMVPEPTTRPFLARLATTGVAVDHTVLTGSGHGMLGRWREWHALTAAAVGQLAAARTVANTPDGGC